MIRPFRLSDILIVAHLQREVVSLDLEWQLTRSITPLRAAVFSRTIIGCKGMCTCIADQGEESGLSRGLAQMRQRRHYPEYIITCLAPALASREGSHALWQRLLASLYVQAGERGGHRVYAGLPPDGEETQIFRNMGFAAYAQENIYEWHPTASEGDPVIPLSLRRQRDRDSWGLQQLYAQVTPRGVQNAEGSAQSEWEINDRPYSLHLQRWGLVWDGPGEITAAVQIRSRRRGHWLKMLLHPDAGEYASALVAAALAQIKYTKGKRVFCAVRTYQSALDAALTTHGFHHLTTQTLVVKPCIVLARDALGQMIPSLNGQPEKAAPTAIKYDVKGNKNSI